VTFCYLEHAGGRADATRKAFAGDISSGALRDQSWTREANCAPGWVPENSKVFPDISDGWPMMLSGLRWLEPKRAIPFKGSCG